MVNFSLNLASIVGISIAIGGAMLYAVRSWRPELSRDTDLFFAAVGLLCGGILFFYGWRFDPIMQFGQILLGGSAIYFAFDNIRLRGVTTTQAKRQSRIVDDERPVSNVYRVDAELDEIEPYEEGPIRRRIKGSQDPRASRSPYYADEAPRRPSTRRSPPDRTSPEGRTRTRRPRPPERPTNGQYDEWEASVDSEERATRRSSSRTARRPPTGSRPPRPRPPEEETSRRPSRDEEATPTDYVDYQPIDSSDDEPETDNSGNFDY